MRLAIGSALSVAASLRSSVADSQLTSEEVEAVLRRHADSRRSSVSNLAMRIAAKERGFRFWDGAEARSSPDAARLFDAASCTRSAQRIAQLSPGSEVAMGYVLRAGQSSPLVYSFAFRGDVVLDGGMREYGRALGYLGVVVDLADLGVVSGPDTLREGFASLVRRGPSPKPVLRG